MITAGTSPFLYIDLREDEPGLILQRRERGGKWLDVKKGKEVVKSPIDVEKLPPGKYRLL